MKNTIVYLSGLQGSGKSIFANSIVNSLEIEADELPTPSKIETKFQKKFQSYDYIVVTEGSINALRMMYLKGLAESIGAKFVNAVII